jgi:hypothetical protein
MYLFAFVGNIALSLHRLGEVMRFSQVTRQSPLEGRNDVIPKHWPPIPPRTYAWYTLLLKIKSTQEPQCSRKIHVNENLQ